MRVVVALGGNALLAAILALSIVLDVVWARRRPRDAAGPPPSATDR